MFKDLAKSIKPAQPIPCDTDRPGLEGLFSPDTSDEKARKALKGVIRAIEDERGHQVKMLNFLILWREGRVWGDHLAKETVLFLQPKKVLFETHAIACTLAKELPSNIKKMDWPKSEDQYKKWALGLNGSLKDIRAACGVYIDEKGIFSKSPKPVRGKPDPRFDRKKGTAHDLGYTSERDFTEITDRLNDLWPLISKYIPDALADFYDEVSSEIEKTDNKEEQKWLRQSGDLYASLLTRIMFPHFRNHAYSLSASAGDLLRKVIVDRADLD